MADTSDEKKARLDAIRAANAAKKAAAGDEPAAAPAPAAPVVAATTEAPASAAVGANMSDDKKARLEAIRAAKKAAASDAPAAPVAVAATPAPAAAPVVAATPAAAPVAPAAPKPAAPASNGNDLITANSIISLTMLGRLKRIIVGVLFCGLIGLGLATVTGAYLIGGLFGVFIGLVGGLMVGDWPAVKTTGD